MNNETISSHSLVLGGGGVTGIAWLTGLLFALENNGLDINKFDQIIGTSAGSAVGAQISSGTSLEDLYQRQIDPGKQVAELTPTISSLSLILKLLPALLSWRNPEKFRQRIGNMALKAKTVSSTERLNVIEARLPNHEWPSLDLKLVAIDAADGKALCFDKNSQVSLVDAVAASCAVPGVWPPVKIHQNDYIDGGMRSADNADYAKNAKTVLILTPAGAKYFSMPGSSLTQEINILKESGSSVLFVKPDPNSLRAMGANPLNPAKRGVSAIAGKAQGDKEAEIILAHLK